MYTGIVDLAHLINAHAATNHQTKLAELDHESARRLLLSTLTVTIYPYYSDPKLILFEFSAGLIVF